MNPKNKIASLDGVRGHKLMPASIKSKIPKLYSQEDVSDPTVWVKFFNPYGRGVWYITEFDGRDTMFGWADLGYGELGYVSLNELEKLERNGLPLIERDLSWRPMPLSKAKSRRASQTKEAGRNARHLHKALLKYLDDIRAKEARESGPKYGKGGKYDPVADVKVWSGRDIDTYAPSGGENADVIIAFDGAGYDLFSYRGDYAMMGAWGQQYRKKLHELARKYGYHSEDINNWSMGFFDE